MKDKETVKEYITLKETKTTKYNKVKIATSLKNDILQFANSSMESLDEYVFASRKKKEGKKQPINRQTAWNIIKNVAEETGLDNIGTHSLRKTFGYHMYQKGVKIEVIQDMLNHSTPKHTLRYIGINQDVKDEAIEALGL